MLFTVRVLGKGRALTEDPWSHYAADACWYDPPAGAESWVRVLHSLVGRLRRSTTKPRRIIGDRFLKGTLSAADRPP